MFYCRHIYCTKCVVSLSEVATTETIYEHLWILVTCVFSV